MDGLLSLLFQVAIPVLLLVVGGLIGRARERAHLVDIARREQESAHILVVDIRRPPGLGTLQAGAVLVTGSVVVASDYFKRFAAGLRSIVGGEVRSLNAVLDRGRREARLRMVEEAMAGGATMVINVRFTTSTIAQGASEVICYGTALRKA